MATIDADTSASDSGAATLRMGYGQQLPQGREHVRVLPASANWYCSKICDWGYSAVYGLLFAFGAKDSVFLYQVALDGDDSESTHTSPTQPRAVRSTSPRFFAHMRRGKRDQRVTALQFLNSGAGNSLQLLCGGEEGGVQIWDVATLALVAQHRKHGSTEVMAVASVDAALVVAGDRQGRISVWQRDEESVSVFTPVAGDGVFAMAMAPHDRALVAVGYRSGVLCIVDAPQGLVRYRLDGHDQEVQSIAWKISPTAAGSAESTDVWLASSSRDRSIKVWSVKREQEPSVAQVLMLPKPKQASSYNQSKRLWLPIAWSYEAEDGYGNDASVKASAPLRLWSGSFDGNLFAWEWTPAADAAAGTYTKKPRQSIKPTVVKNGHSRLLFNIVSLSPSVGVPLAKHASAPTMLSMSLDRELRIWRETGSTSGAGSSPSASVALTCCDKMVGLGGHVYSVAYNPSSEVVASGVGDQTIRLWQVSAKSSLRSLYSADLLWKGLQSKVTCVAWHPFQRSLLGYGTEDGHVGVFDVETKKSVRFKSYHSSQVHTLQWRVKQPQLVQQPQQDDTAASESDKSAFVQAMLALESAQASGRSLEDALRDQDAEGTKHDPQELRVLLWSQDAHRMQILESNPDKPEVASVEVSGLPACTSFAWDTRGEQLAIGRENGGVEIYASAVSASTGQQQPSGFALVQKFHEHEQRVVCLSWCPPSPSSSAAESGGLLAAGSQDGKVIVFNLSGSPRKKTSQLTLSEHVVGVFTGHSNAVTSLCWGVFGSDPASTSGSEDREPTALLASSSTDGTVQVWDLDAHTRVSCFRHHIGRVLSVDWVNHFVLVSGGEDQTIRMWDYREQREPEAKKSKAVSPATKSEQTTSKMAKSAANGGAPHQNGHGTHTHQAKSNRIDTENAAATKLSAKSTKKKKAQQAIFHADAFAAESNWEQLAQVLLLEGRVGEALRVVAKEGALNASWLAFAPMAGLDVWREITNVYAHQLDAQGDKRNAALHFTSIGKTRAAIRSLASGHLFGEALALIQSRLGARDPLFRQTLLEHAAFLERRERFGEAAQVLLSTGSVSCSSRAVAMLAKTGDIRAFEIALDVCASLQHTNADHEDVGGDYSIPNRVFLEIISKALSLQRFGLAERAGRYLGTGGFEASSLPASISTRVTRCVLGIMNAFTRHSLSSEDAPIQGDGERLAASTATAIPGEAQAFFAFLLQHHKRSYSASSLLTRSGAGDSTSLRNRSERMWRAMLALCEANGFWFGASSEEEVLGAQELLMDKNCFAYLATSSSASGDGALNAIMSVSRCLLQFLLDVVSGYLLSGLERVRDAFDALRSVEVAGAEDREFELATLFFPSGFVDPDAPPRIGELAIEVQDTAALWRSFLLCQCRAALSIAKAEMKKTAIEDGDVGSRRAMLGDLLGAELASQLLSAGSGVGGDLERDEFAQRLLEELRADLEALLPADESSPVESTGNRDGGEENGELCGLEADESSEK